jgi:uncharacterized membrane protein
MTGVTQGRGETPVRWAPATMVVEEGRHIGVVTRSLSWLIDAAVINVVAIGTGLGVELITSVFPVSHKFAEILKPVSIVVYTLWTVLYFVGFWWFLGQTLGARVMRIRLETAKRMRVKPVRGVVRWIGMNLAMLPLFLGYAPILFGRRGFPDWLAHTQVLGVVPAEPESPVTRGHRDRGGRRQPKALLTRGAPDDGS